MIVLFVVHFVIAVESEQNLIFLLQSEQEYVLPNLNFLAGKT